MLARMRALVLAHHGKGRLGDLAHGAHVLVELEIEHRADVQAALGGVRIPCAGRPVRAKHLCQPVGVIRQMIERHGTILDKGHGLARLLHRHHDVEPGLAQLADLGGKRHVPDLDHAPLKGATLAEAIAQIGEGIVETADVLIVLGWAVGKLDQEQGGGRAAHELLQRSGVERDGAGEVDHRRIDQFDRGRPKRHQRLCGLHRGAKGGKVADAQHASL